MWDLSFWIRGPTCVRSIGRQPLNHWMGTKEVPSLNFSVNSLESPWASGTEVRTDGQTDEDILTSTLRISHYNGQDQWVR